MNHLDIAKSIARQFSNFEQTKAVALGGSVATGHKDANSDIDLYVYHLKPIKIEARAQLIEARASHSEIDSSFWETEDYWIEKESGIKVEVIYRDGWLFETLEDMFANNRAHMGFSTSFWHNVLHSKVLFDREGWFARLQALADRPYPEELARAIIKKNFALLRGSLAEHPKQLALAIEREDYVFAHSRINVIMDSYFDILFALNKAPHPGSKRQLSYANALAKKPKDMTQNIRTLLTEKLDDRAVIRVKHLIDELEHLLKLENHI